MKEKLEHINQEINEEVEEIQRISEERQGEIYQRNYQIEQLKLVIEAKDCELEELREKLST